jgi:hypothetical protein
MVDIQLATSKIFHRVHRTGEEIKNDLPNWVELIIKDGAWKSVVNPATGKPFETVGQWLVANYPLGPGMGHGEFAITYDELIVLSDKRPKLKDMLVKFRPKKSNGRPKKETVDNVNGFEKPTGNSRLYIEERLQRDHPEIWQDYLQGKYKSARQAGIAAGFIARKLTHAEQCVRHFDKADDRLTTLRSILERLEAQEREVLRDWLAS